MRVQAIWPKSRLNDFWYILSDPTPSRLAGMLLAGQQSTWPKLLFIANRMKIERLIEAGLLYGDSTEANTEDVTARGGREIMNMHGQAMRSSAESADQCADGSEMHALRKEHRRSSVLEELRRQSGIFFDDMAVDGETGESEEEEAIVDHDGHGKAE